MEHTHNVMPVLGYEGLYAATSDGEIISLARISKQGRPIQQKILKQSTRPDGRKSVNLFDQHGGKTHLVHRLVLSAFKGPQPYGLEACHNDGNCANNRIDNLRWDSRAENCKDRIAHGAYKTKCPAIAGWNHGSNNGVAKLTESAAIAIKRDGRRNAVIAAEHGVHQSVVSRIKSGKAWAHVK